MCSLYEHLINKNISASERKPFILFPAIGFSHEVHAGKKTDLTKSSQMAAAHPAAELAGHARRRRMKTDIGYLIHS